jgi:hypothetical protein
MIVSVLSWCFVSVLHAVPLILFQLTTDWQAVCPSCHCLQWCESHLAGFLSHSEARQTLSLLSGGGKQDGADWNSKSGY